MQIRLMSLFLISPLVWLVTACATVPPQAAPLTKPPDAAVLPRGGEASPVVGGALLEANDHSTRVLQPEFKQTDKTSTHVETTEYRSTILALGFGARETPPQGLLDFCARQPRECGQPTHIWHGHQQASGFMKVGLGPDFSDLPSTVTPKANHTRPIRSFSATKTDIATLNQVNRQINRAMVGVTDQTAFGRNEFWTMPLSAPELRSVRTKPLADCEDFALEKRRALIAAGIPESAIYLAVAMSPRTNLHAVVIVATDRGDFVLDNLNDWLLGYQETGYTWVKRQSTTSLFDWTDAPVAALSVLQMASLPSAKRSFHHAQATITTAADDWSKPRWREPTADALN